mmetsp:Transcript_31285/g.61781  ORF Transcript_31285/g.61781 Transcript_31285/m.61781 type:complete len:109 (+) Transcript_31285:577-903(+)
MYQKSPQQDFASCIIKVCRRTDRKPLKSAMTYLDCFLPSFEPFPRPAEHNAEMQKVERTEDSREDGSSFRGEGGTAAGFCFWPPLSPLSPARNVHLRPPACMIDHVMI